MAGISPRLPLEEIEARLQRQLYKYLQLNPKIKLVELHSIERSPGKAKRGIDMR